jgi:phenylalanyl-tRNA synthetase alpha chain
MKMYIKPINKDTLERYLAIPDLTKSKQPHAVKLLYQKIENHIRLTHPDSQIMVYRASPIVSVEDNYDNLLIDKDNISRSSTYTHYVDKNHILLTHDTAHIPGILRDLAKQDDWDDVVILTPAVVYRRDVTDKKHLSAIQMLGIWRVCKNKPIVRQDLRQVVEGVAKVAAPGWKLRIVDMPHPYTTEGMEVNAVKGDRDIEILECGLINSRILANAGLDPKIYSGWASGIGLDRLVMTLKSIPDIRYLRSANPKIAAQMRDLEPYREVSNQPAIQRDMSYSVPHDYVEEDINEYIRNALGDSVGILESVEVLSESPYKELPDKIRARLGISSSQKNVLVRVTLRHLEKTLTKQEANQLYEQIYSAVNHGTGGYLI